MSLTEPIKLVRLGRVAYRHVLALMHCVVEARRLDQIGDTLLLVEHRPVLTLRRGGGELGVCTTQVATQKCLHSLTREQHECRGTVLRRAFGWRRLTTRPLARLRCHSTLQFTAGSKVIHQPSFDL